MSADISSSPGSLAAVLAESANSYIAIEKSACVDLSSALVSFAEGVRRKGTDVLLVAAGKRGAARLRRAAELQGFDRGLKAVSIEELCLDVVSDSRVSSAIVRDSRILDDNEFDILLEDLKLSGLKPRRLREMIRFFQKGMSEMADESANWLISAEEQAVFALLQANMSARRAMLSSEAASLAYRGMAESGIEPPTRMLVVDDFGAMSKAAQRLIRHLSTNGMVAAGALEGAAREGEPYPFYEGMRDLVDDPSFLTVRVCGSATVAESAVVSYRSPLEEFEGIAEAVARLLAEGADPDNVMIAVPKPLWGKKIRAALEARSIPSFSIDGKAKVRGNPRIAGQCAAIRLRSFLKLWENPDDVVALRTWIGLGDWLVCSDAFAEAMTYARDAGIELFEVIRAVEGGEVPDRIASRFAPALEELAALREALREASPTQAANVFEHACMPLGSFERTLLGCGTSADVDALARGVLRESGEAEVGVRVGCYDSCCGEHAETVFMCGMVQGFMPSHDALDEEGYHKDHRIRALARDRALFEDVRAMAGKRFVQSYFEEDLLENADALRMKPARIVVKGKDRHALLVRSEFLND